jgi:hypothetical protein
MKAGIYPLQVLLWTFSGWVNRQKQDVIASLTEENRVLKEQIKGPSASPDQRAATDPGNCGLGIVTPGFAWL